MSCIILPRQHLPCCLQDLCQANIWNLQYSKPAKLPQGNLMFPHLFFLFHLLFVHHFEIPSSELALILCQQL